MWYIKRVRASKDHLRSDATEAQPKGLMMEIPIPEWENRKTDSKTLGCRKVASSPNFAQVPTWWPRHVWKHAVFHADCPSPKQERHPLAIDENARGTGDAELQEQVSRTLFYLFFLLKIQPLWTTGKRCIISCGYCRDLFHNIISKAATKEVVQAILKIIQQRSQSDDTTAMLVSRLSGMSFVNSGKMIKQMMVSGLYYC